ncbi:MAG: hypothetical protein J5925_02575 [Clostridia bacterium]|nr:hypothetical protein [Clostridia bacterium]MBR5746414.1 hypothetical protein [Clostridia bacterium]
MKAIKKAVSRLKSKAGESIVEVLVALLIASLGMVLLAGMINAASQLITKSKNSMDDFVSAENAAAARSGAADAEGSAELHNSSGDAVKFSDENTGVAVEVAYYGGSGTGDGRVYSYKVKQP